MYVCPTCQRQFPEPGFCPFDGQALDSRDVPTMDIEPSGLTGAVESPSHDLIGRELDGRYRIERQIGEGGMGVVYLAQHMIIEKAVAIKVLKAEVAADQNIVQRFVQEARAASRIGHPNIIDVTDFGTTSLGMVYQVMEYLDGQTLSAALRTAGPFSISRSLRIVAQVARALSAAHEKGIVHRDLKPDNIFLLDREGRHDFVKIVDFGIAKVQPTQEHAAEPRLTRVGTIFGTPEYMAPEQAAGRADVDHRADIYALGIIAYEMLVGHVPFRGSSTMRTLSMQMLDAPQPLHLANPNLQISEGLGAAILRSLTKSPKERYESAGEFLETLEEVTVASEFDLPSVLKNERDSAESMSQNATFSDIAPETEALPPIIPQPEPHERRLGRHARATDPVFVGRRNSTHPPLGPDILSDFDDPVESRPNRNLQFVALAFLLMAGSVGAFVYLRQPTNPVASNFEVRALADATSIPPKESDAATLAMIPVDAGTKVLMDAQIRRPSEVPLRPRRSDKPRPALRQGGKEQEVTIATRPRGARLFIDGTYAGSDGLNLRRTLGTELTLTCTLKGFRDGRVKVEFDGKQEVFLCRLRELTTPKCVEGLSNPYEKCP